MNLYIKSDIENGLKYLKIGIMNLLSAFESGELTEINLEHNVPGSLILEYAEEQNYVISRCLDGYYEIVSPNKIKIIIEENPTRLWKLTN